MSSHNSCEGYTFLDPVWKEKEPSFVVLQATIQARDHLKTLESVENGFHDCPSSHAPLPESTSSFRSLLVHFE